ncbi:MAG: hypothetical protein KAH38_08710 [Candidatus Hydrogenedentes bacterium]|nr:hypothetical protein [Candidatus Hydrogenedentota bacterium]
MTEKNLGLSMFVPGLWVSSIVWFLIYTLFSPILFIGMLFSPSMDEIILQIDEASPFDLGL